MDEARLVRYCKENNALAQKALYNTYAEPMMLVCLRYLEREDARETLMDGFLSCFKNISAFSYRGEGSLKAWLKKIMINQCLMRLRKKQPVFISHTDDLPVEPASTMESVWDTMNAKEIMSRIQALPDGCRTVFNLYVFEGMGHKEIAGLLEITEGTSKSQLHRARQLLKETLLQTSQHIL